MSDLDYLDEIAREAHAGNYVRTGALSKGEVLYVALASGRMRELCPSDSIAYAVDRMEPGWMDHMLSVWRADGQPDAKANSLSEFKKETQWKLLRDLDRVKELDLWCQAWPQRAAEVEQERSELQVSIPELRAVLAYIEDFEREK